MEKQARSVVILVDLLAAVDVSGALLEVTDEDADACPRGYAANRICSQASFDLGRQRGTFRLGPAPAAVFNRPTCISGLDTSNKLLTYAKRKTVKSLSRVQLFANSHGL